MIWQRFPPSIKTCCSINFVRGSVREKYTYVRPSAPGENVSRINYSFFPRVHICSQTLVGDILVSVNPFRPLPIYGREVLLSHAHFPAIFPVRNFTERAYVPTQHLFQGKRDHSTSSSRAGRQTNRSAPHIYSVADAAYHAMLSTGSDQCCVIRLPFLFFLKGDIS